MHTAEVMEATRSIDEPEWVGRIDAMITETITENDEAMRDMAILREAYLGRISAVSTNPDDSV